MSDMTAALAQQAIAAERSEPAGSGADRPLALLFFSVVLAIYGAIGYGVYSLVF